jgi:DNA-binding transcriptional MerR regulator/methylmalonyl-CoA mutase cobalamin-binding subunit
MTDAEGPRHRIGAVARLTGVSTHALRVWERRYGIPAPERTEAGGRLYSQTDVHKLRSIKRLLEYGHAIGDIARLSERQLEELLAEHQHLPETRANGASRETVERYLDALQALDLDAAERVLQRSAIARNARDFIQNVAEPLVGAIGERWQSGALCVANEHAASAMLRTHLGALLASLPNEPGAPALVSATVAGERHEFGALFAAIVAALAGWRVVYLGADLPASEIATAARVSGAQAVLVSVVALSARKARSEIDALLRALPRRVRLVAGGSGSAAVRDVRGVEHAPDLFRLDELLRVPS